MVQIGVNEFKLDLDQVGSKWVQMPFTILQKSSFSGKYSKNFHQIGKFSFAPKSIREINSERV